MNGVTIGCVSASDPIMRQCCGRRRRGGEEGPDPASVEVLPHKANVCPPRPLKHQRSSLFWNPALHNKDQSTPRDLLEKNRKVKQCAMIPVLEEVEKEEEVVRVVGVPGLGFLDKRAADKLGDILQV